MALSEEEIRMLQQMERALVEEDPKFASTLRGTSLRQIARRRAVVAGAVFMAGIGVLMAGAVLRLTWLALVGFLIMLASASVAVTAVRGGGRPDAEPETPPEEGFRQRFERHWHDRHDDDGL